MIDYEGICMKPDEIVVLTLDGPGGSGKGTIAQLVAQRLGWHILDSGALYRLVGLAASNRNVSMDDPEALAELARNLDTEFALDGSIMLDHQEVSASIRTEEVGALASQVAAVPAVRDALLERQRAFRQPPGLVADGRDMGTTVFPDAQIKVFLTASAEERAKRRYKQLKDKGINVSFPNLLADIIQRDKRDMERAVSPLVPAADAVQLDTTDLTIEEVVQRVLDLVNA